MTWYDESTRETNNSLQTTIVPQLTNTNNSSKLDHHHQFRSIITCPSCGHVIQLLQHQSAILEDLPAGVKFDPSDQEILQHLEAKALMSDRRKLQHPLIDEFIPTIDGENGICYTHPEKLPGVSKDGQIRHFFHRPSKAYTTGTRKRRKVHTDIGDGSSSSTTAGETRWHKTGKTRPVFMTGGGGIVKGYKKILVLYTNYGRQRKPEKTNWVMHQYHLGEDEEEKDGELVVSKVFYQTQPRQCNTNVKEIDQKVAVAAAAAAARSLTSPYNPSFMEYYGHHQYVGTQNRDSDSCTPPHDDQLILPNITVHGHGDCSSFVHIPSGK